VHVRAQHEQPGHGPVRHDDVDHPAVVEDPCAAASDLLLQLLHHGPRGVRADRGRPAARVMVGLVADELADHGVEAAQRVRQENAFQHLDIAALATRHHGRNKVAGAVIAEARRSLPRRAIVGAGNVSDVMLEVMFLKTQFLSIDIESHG